MLLAKAALTVGGTFVLAGAYTMREGVMRIDVDEYRTGGSHVHMWVPAAAVPMALHFVPDKHLRHASEHVREAMPILHAIVKELKKYPDTEFVEVDDYDEHVRVRTQGGRLQIDVDAPDQKVHVLCPLSTIEDVTIQLEQRGPAA
ncbi:MAG TPA: hypothetical protein VEW05_04305 [Candidatus Polarisedimenticolia bacterium]|nr:hypothetical protein [Candidatus Polarisedimenticolia bacterium]